MLRWILGAAWGGGRWSSLNAAGTSLASTWFPKHCSEPGNGPRRPVWTLGSWRSVTALPEAGVDTGYRLVLDARHQARAGIALPVPVAAAGPTDPTT